MAVNNSLLSNRFFFTVCFNVISDRTDTCTYAARPMMYGTCDYSYRITSDIEQERTTLAPSSRYISVADYTRKNAAYPLT